MLLARQNQRRKNEERNQGKIIQDRLLYAAYANKNADSFFK